MVRSKAHMVFSFDWNNKVHIRGVSEPILGIVVQGKKEVLLSEETYRYGAAQYLVVSVDLPICGFAVEATPDQPYLRFKLN